MTGTPLCPAPPPRLLSRAHAVSRTGRGIRSPSLLQIPRWLLYGVITLLLATLHPARAAERPDSSLRMATSLSTSGEHAGAALEFRRQAISTPAPAAQAILFWAAAREYHRAGQYPLVDTMLDAAENADPSLLAPTLLLHGETAVARRDWPTASFYFQSLANPANSSNIVRFAARRLAVTELNRHDPAAARRALLASPEAEPIPSAALTRYEQGHDKRPWLGGLLGLVPGLGYAYSGEYANAARSLILNSLFIFGMVDTAERDNWGGFAAITFFELTWYSGSIYGGIDAAHRYNRDRIATCTDGIMNNAAFEPDYATFPALTIHFQF